VRSLLRQRSASRRSPGFAGCSRIYLHHIRKTGGTSITDAILELGGEEPREVEARAERALPHVTETGGMVVVGHDRIALGTGWFQYGWSHTPAWSLRLPRDCYTVTVLRDPLSRIVSLYNYLADPHSDDGHAFTAPLEERLLAASGLDDFIARLPREELLRQTFMFSRRFDPAEAAERVSACSLVLRTERLGEGIAELSSVVGYDLRLKHQRRSSAPATVSASELSDGQRSRLMELLEPEYEFLARLQ
jgi:hypothetical protein